MNREALKFDEAIPSEIAKSYEVSEKPKNFSSTNNAGKAPTVLPESAPATVAALPEQKKKRGDRKTKIAEASPTIVDSGIPNRRPNPDPFRQNEKVLFDVTWLKTTAGELSLEVLPMKYIEGRKVYHFKGSARTTSLVSSFYRAEDYVESFVDYVGLFPYKFILHGDESKHIRDNLELFDHVKKKQYIYIKDDRLNGDVREDKGIKDLVPFSQDTLSGLYYMRTLKLEQGKSENIAVATSGSMTDLKLTNLGKDEVKTKAGRFNCIKVKAEVNYKREKSFDENIFWMTDDDRRLIVKFEVKVRIGWMGAVAKLVELGVPFSAE